MTVSREQPFIAALKERRRLNSPDSDKFTYHLEIDLAGSGLRYRVGDSIGVLPRNPTDVVARTVEQLGGDSELPIALARSDETLPLQEALASRLNICDVPQKLAKLAAEQGCGDMTTIAEDRKALKEHLSHYKLWDFLEHYQPKITPQEVVEMLRPLMPRFYSIASAQCTVGDEVHLTIADVTYTTRDLPRSGVCTDFLLRQAPVGEATIPLYLQPTKDFLLPEDPSVPVIMVGPGTGVAPFRAFMQERTTQGCCGPHWLFFGERKRDHDFLYRQEWQQWTADGTLKLETAFSRDQQEKHYVQHRMLEQGEELWKWLQDGAYLYVCGDATRMAKDVEEALGQIAHQYGEQDPKAFIKELRQQKRYLRDVY